MKIDVRNEWPMWLLIALMFVLGVTTWSVAPDQLPVHWGLSGQPDRWGGKFEGLLMMPCLGLLLYFVMTFMPRIDPGRMNYPSFAGSFHTVRILLSLVALTAIEVLIVFAARGYAVNVNAVVPVVVGATFVVLGNLFGKLRPNWFIGIRTPWTLSSKLAWDRTHRAGGWVFIALGLLLMVSSLLRDTRFLIGIYITTGVAVAGLAVYSFVVWKGDPDRVPPAGTTPAE